MCCRYIVRRVRLASVCRHHSLQIQNTPSTIENESTIFNWCVAHEQVKCWMQERILSRWKRLNGGISINTKMSSKKCTEKIKIEEKKKSSTAATTTATANNHRTFFKCCSHALFQFPSSCMEHLFHLVVSIASHRPAHNPTYLHQIYIYGYFKYSTTNWLRGRETWF